MASSKVDKKRQLMAMKYNQRSQLQFEFTEHGKCGRRGRLWESLPSQDKKMINVELEDKDGEHHLVWSQPPTNILVIKKFKDVGVTRKFKELTTWLVKDKMLQVTVEPSIFAEKEIKDDPEFSEVKNSFSTWSPDDKESQKKVLDEIDLIICVGGDGTLLYTSSMFQENFPPIMSFHLGSLGFLTPFQFTLEDSKHLPSCARNADEKIYRTYIEKVLKGGVSLTLRHRLECKISTMDMVSTASTPEDVCLLTPSPDSSKPRMNFTHFDTKDKRPWASKPHKQMLVMNDLVVDRGPNAYLTNLLIKCNGRAMTTVQGDGVIIATPTGSTAYSLAAGASMVHPSVPCMVVTPICPHSLSFRSIVVPSGVELEITLSDSSRSSAWVSFDGRNRQEISKGESVVVSTCKWPIPSINNTGHVTDWFDSLSECLHWNVRKEQKQFSSS